MAGIQGTGKVVNVNGFIHLETMNGGWKDGSVGKVLAVKFGNLS